MLAAILRRPQQLNDLIGKLLHGFGCHPMFLAVDNDRLVDFVLCHRGISFRWHTNRLRYAVVKVLWLLVAMGLDNSIAVFYQFFNRAFEA